MKINDYSTGKNAEKAIANAVILQLKKKGIMKKEFFNKAYSPNHEFLYYEVKKNTPVSEEIVVTTISLLITTFGITREKFYQILQSDTDGQILTFFVNCINERIANAIKDIIDLEEGE